MIFRFRQEEERDFNQRKRYFHINRLLSEVFNKGLENNVHKTELQSRSVVIIVLHMLSVRTHFSKSNKTNKFPAKTMFTTGETVDLAEWIIDDTCLVFQITFLKAYQHGKAYRYSHEQGTTKYHKFTAGPQYFS